MKNKKYIYLLFGLLILAQLLVPLQMIFEQENIIKTGKIFKFKTAPVDPSDPLRGKYIYLSFSSNTIIVKNSKNWKINQTLFATIITNKNGFAEIKAVSKKEPANQLDYLKLKINYINVAENKISLNFPFDKLYMNEYKALNAEDAYRQSNQKIQNNSCAVVAIKQGKSVLIDVLIDGVSVKNLNAKQLSKKQTQ